MDMFYGLRSFQKMFYHRECDYEVVINETIAFCSILYFPILVCLCDRDMNMSMAYYIIYFRPQYLVAD